MGNFIKLRPLASHTASVSLMPKFFGPRIWGLHSRSSSTRILAIRKDRLLHCRNYYSASNPITSTSLYPPAETAILSAAVSHIPTHGFTEQTLALGARDAAYLPASTNLFTRGPFDLVLFHNASQRFALRDRLPVASSSMQPVDSPTGKTGKPLGVGAKVRLLALARLHANAELIQHYSQAIALMSLASNIAPSLAELARLSDEIWYLAGDVKVDTSWYTKRGLLAAVYASTEVFMTQDHSKDFAETEKFLDRRLADVQVLGSTASSVGEWVGFTGQATVNVLRSWGARI